MTATKISADPVVSAPDGTETIPVLSGGVNKRMTLAAIPIPTAVATALGGKVSTSSVGAANGVAALGSDGKVPAGQLPTGSAGTVLSTGITDSSAAGRALLTAADAAAQKTALAVSKTDVGLGNVDNTSDANKPVSTAQATALSGKAPTSHTHASTDISDSSAPGRTLLTAASAAAQKTALSLVKGDVGLGSVDNTADTAKPVSTAQQSALDGKETIGTYTAGINTQTGTAYTLVLADKGKLVEMNNASANTLTVPLNSAAAFPIGSRVDIEQYGAGQTTIAATGGVTIRSAGGKLKLTGQYSGATLIKRGTDEWVLVGDLAA